MFENIIAISVSPMLSNAKYEILQRDNFYKIAEENATHKTTHELINNLLFARVMC